MKAEETEGDGDRESGRRGAPVLVLLCVVPSSVCVWSVRVMTAAKYCLPPPCANKYR